MQTVAHCYDAADQVVGWQYDAAGNLLSDGTSRWSYDALGRMIAAGRGLETRTYTYNGDGVLVAETSGGSTTRYAQDLAAPLSQVLQIQQGASSTRVVYGEDRLFSVADGVRRWYGADALGSVRQTWGDADMPSAPIWYDPWGQVEQGSVPTFGFTGELHDAAFDMVHLRARWYNPTHGTFTAARWRTSESSPYVPLSNHVYAYALANPVNWTDPTGKCIPYLDRDCLPVWEIGQGANGEDFGNYWFTVGNTVKDTVVGPAQMLYDVATQEETRARVARGAQVLVRDPIGSAGTVLSAAATPFTDIYQGIVCGDSTQLGRGLTGFGLMLGSARVARAFQEYRNPVAKPQGLRIRGDGAFDGETTYPYRPTGRVYGQSDANSCVAASCRMILSEPLPEAWLRAAADVTDKGGFLSKVPGALRQFEPSLTTTYKPQLSLEQLRSAIQRGPAIVAVQTEATAFGRHALVVDGFNGNMVLIRDPWPPGQGSAYAIDVRTFEAAWANDAVIVK